jgi:hypothetical protein
MKMVAQEQVDKAKTEADWKVAEADAAYAAYAARLATDADVKAAEAAAEEAWSTYCNLRQELRNESNKF